MSSAAITDQQFLDRLGDSALQVAAVGNGVNVTHTGIEGGEGSRSLPEDPPAPAPEAS